MSIVLPNIDLSIAVVGTKTSYDFSTLVQTGVSPLQVVKLGPPKLQFLNESPVGMQVQLAQSLRSYNIAAGAWGSLDLDADDKGFYWTPQYILLPNPAVNLLLLTYLPPGDNGTAINVLGNSPIQGVTTTNVATTANELQGIGQTKGLTEIDDLNPFGSGSLANYDQNAILIPMGANALHGQALELASRSIVGATEIGLSIAAGEVFITNNLASVDGVATVGSFGVPAIVVDTGAVAVGNTVQTNIFSYTPAADGNFELIYGMKVANGTSGNVVNLVVTFNDRYSNAAQTRGTTVVGNTVTLNTNAGTSFANGDYDSLAQFIPAKAGTAIILKYRDPTNTPNDTIYAILKQIGK